MPELAGAQTSSVGYPAPSVATDTVATEIVADPSGVSSPALHLEQVEVLAARGGDLTDILDAARGLRRRLARLREVRLEVARSVGLLTQAIAQTPLAPVASGVVVPGVLIQTNSGSYPRRTTIIGQLSKPIQFINTNAEQTYFQTTVPAGTLGTTGRLRFRAFWSVPIPTASAILVTARWYFGSTSLSHVMSSGGNNATFDLYLQGVISAAGKTNSQEWESWGEMSTGGVDGIGTISTGSQMQSGVGSTGIAVDSTIRQTFKFTLQVATAFAATGPTLEVAYLEAF